ncbi:autotransporter-associated beta strand repeat-containing protein [Sulfitobacter sp. F26204]|uniref:beta strand repeat-containing protein n=1 Tax=Sulfitobacter sp. F26204 TaxID=2996014 RepID=UPI00225E643C|nr:autotransporter-associated beta strand repeat-containing protein [Sulfitobacter sp. F26204]MCX7561654.1 autotransporter-associated beta strand repeat-containing protein [Sulfitobacter sp. F26204]
MITALDLDGGAGHTIADTAMVTGATTIDNATLTQTGGALTTVTLGANGILTASSGTATTVTASAASSDVDLSGDVVITALDLDGGAGHTIADTAMVTGATTIDDATLTISATDALSDTNSVTLGGAGALVLLADETIGTLVGTGAATTVNVNGNALTLAGGSSTYEGMLTGAGSLNKIAAGTLTLTGNNAGLTGGMNISGGAVVAGNSDDAFGIGLITLGSDVLPASTGTMAVTATTGVSNDIAVAAAGGTISALPGVDANLTGGISTAGALTFDGGGDATFAGMVSGAGSLSNIAGGTLTLTGDNSGLTGGLSVSGTGVISGSNDGVLNTLGTGTITLEDGTLNVTADSTIANALTVAAAGGTLDADAGVDVVLTGNIDAAGILTVASDDLTTISGVMSGAGGLTVDSAGGTGQLTLTNVNTYTGTTTVENGILVLGNANSIADDGAVVVNDRLNLATTNETIGSLAGTGTVALDGNTLTIAQSGTLAVPVVTEFSGVIAGAGNPLPGPDVVALVVNSVTDTLVLSGVNTFTGLTDVQSGTLRIGDGGSVLGDVDTAGTFANEGTVGGLLTVTAGMASNEGAGALTDVAISGGTFETGIATLGVTPATTTVSGTATITGGTMNVTGGTVNAAVNTNGILNVNGGTVTTVDSAATSTVGVNGTVATATVTGGTFATAGNITNVLTNNGGGVTVSDGTVASLNNVSGSATITGGNVTAMTNSATATNAGTVGTLSQSAGSFVNSGSVNTAGISGGTFSTSGNVGTLNNTGGSSTVQAGSVGTANNTSGSLTIAAGSVGTLSSSATTTNAGTVGIASISGGTFGNSGSVTGSTTVTAGAVSNSGSLGNVTLTGGSITNISGTIGGVGNTGGTVTINGGSAQSVVNNVGLLTIAGGGEVGAVTNSGTATNAGTVGTLENQAGTFENSGTINGLTTLVNGTITNTGNMGNLASTGGSFVGNAGSVGNVTNNGGALDFAGGTVGTIANNTGTLTLGASSGAVTNSAILDITGTASSLTNNAGTATVSGTVSGFTTVAGGQVTNTGSLNGGVTVNAGDLVSTGTILGTLEAKGGTVSIAGRLDGVLEAGNAEVTITGSLTDVNSITNNGSGTLIIADGTTTLDNGGTVTNAGAMTVRGGLSSANGILANGGNLNIETSGRVAMNITNNGTLNANGAIVGNLANNAGRTANISGTMSGNIVNAANGTVNLTGTQTGTIINRGVTLISGTNDGGVTNNAQLTVAEGGAVAGDIANNNTLDLIGQVTGNVVNASRMRLAGGTVDGTVTNNGVTSLLAGTSFVGSFVNDLEFIAETGTMNYDSFTNNGTALVQSMGILSGGAFANNNTLTVQDGGQITAGTVTNNADLMLNNAGRINANVVNNARLNAFGATQAGGDLTNAESGVINMAGNGSVNDVMTVSGNAVLNGVVNTDINLDPLTPGADRMNVAGAVSGDVVFNFGNLSQDFGTLDGGLTVLSYGSLDPAFAFDQTGLPANGALVYGFINDADRKALVINAGANPAVAGIASGLTLTQSLINTVVNRPSSPFVAGLAAEDDDPCGFGSWARGVGGTADVTGATATSIGSFDSEISASYGGLQVGFDFSCFDSRYAGFDLSFGGILGANTGSLSQPVFEFDPGTASLNRNSITSINDTDFSQTYAGAYIGASRGRLFGDVQLRFDQTSFELTNTLAAGIVAGGDDDIGVADQEYDSSSTTISGSVGYAFPLSEKSGLVFVPALGVSHSRTSVDALRFDGGTPDNKTDDRVLEIDDIVSTVAFASATLSRSKVLPSGTAALNIFGTATYYHDFGKDTTSRLYQLDANGNRQADPLTTTSSNLGAYAELSLGVNYTKLIQPGAFGGARQFDASIRLDGRFSGGLDSVGITGQMRFQF